MTAWLPGFEGRGVADVLFGDSKPTGRQPREWPRTEDQAAANDLNGEPLFPFGFGLTY
jgi:beta-glucosidase